MQDNNDYTSDVKLLNDNICKVLLFYCSDKILDLPLLSDYKEILNVEANPNYLFFSDQDSKSIIKFNLSAENYIKLLNNKGLLESNTLYLLNLKTKVNGELFNFLTQKYLKNLDSYIYFAEILLENYEEYCFIKSDLLKNYLIVQLQLLNEHKAELNKLFFEPVFDFSKLTDALKDKSNEAKEIEAKPKLRDVIIKGDAVAIEKILVKTFSRSQNLDINRIFTALHNLHYIIMKHGDRKFLIQCLNNSIGEKKYSSENVFKSAINTSTDNDYKIIRNTINNLLENLP